VSAAAATRKPFLGGFRHRGTGATYHHAASQTARAGPPPPPPRECRQTQTVAAAARANQTLREAGTQMARPGLEPDDSSGRALTPRPYVSAREVGARREAAALRIQRAARGWLGRRRAAELRALRSTREAFLEERDARRRGDAEETRRCAGGGEGMACGRGAELPWQIRLGRALPGPAAITAPVGLTSRGSLLHAPR
jgi:hypothetical protein